MYHVISEFIFNYLFVCRDVIFIKFGMSFLIYIFVLGHYMRVHVLCPHQSQPELFTLFLSTFSSLY